MLTAKSLKRLLSYDPMTGHFTWNIVAVRQCGLPGRRAGRKWPNGYRWIAFGGEKFLEHRLAWLYMTGSWPDDQVDHINCDKGDNKWSNLRSATAAQNRLNRGKQRNSTTGLKGVSLHRGRWRAKLGRKELGYHATKEAAYAAYCKAIAEMHPEFGRASL